MPAPSSFADALARGVVALDGGLSTELEAAGHDVSTSLWSARLLVQDPAAVVAAHTRFFAAGARVATTASYQVSAQGFAAAGLGADDAERALRRSVALAQDARDRAGLGGTAWVAGSVGPYGAVLADGSEYTGAYAGPDGLDLGALRRFHRPRLHALADAGADVLACETLPAALEVEALLLELAEVDVPAWISLTTALDASGTVRTRRGERADEVFAMVRDAPSVVATGVNCLSPGDVTAALGSAGASGRPLVVYPNSGERWDARERSWAGDPRLSPADVQRWLEAGARLVGGCCRVGPELLADLVQRLPAVPSPAG